MSKVKFLFIFVVLINCYSCNSFYKDTKHSKEIITKSGEKVYIKSINWGMTDDHQISIITKDKNKLNNRTDTIDAISGLIPFLYGYSNDTLTLVFQYSINYHVKDSFKTLKIKYILAGTEYWEKYYNNPDYNRP